MEAHARAGIELVGPVLRYAEVEQQGEEYRLLRLGSCDFDFDVVVAIVQARTPAQRNTVVEALQDVFTGTAASEVQVVLHPPFGYSFFSAVPAGLAGPARQERLQWEAELLGGHAPELPLRIEVTPAHAANGGADEAWYHVLAVEEPVHTAFAHTLNALPVPRFRLTTSMLGAASTMAALIARRTPPPDGGPLALGVGWYPTHVEFALCREGRLLMSHHAPCGDAADAVFFALALLQRLHVPPAQVGRLYVYGEELELDHFALLAEATGATPERLDPMSLVNLDPSELASFNASAYAPCIGASL